MQNRPPDRDPRINKLPKYAQDYIGALERHAEFAVRQHAELTDSQEKTALTYGDHYDNPKYLPEGSSVRIAVGDRDWIEVRPVVRTRRLVATHLDRDYQAIITTSGMLVLSPGSSNVIGVSTTDR